MPSEMEFVNFKDFVDSLPAADDFAAGDKSVLSGATLRKMDKDVQLQKTAEKSHDIGTYTSIQDLKESAGEVFSQVNGKVLRTTEFLSFEKFGYENFGALGSTAVTNSIYFISEKPSDGVCSGILFKYVSANAVKIYKVKSDLSGSGDTYEQIMSYTPSSIYSGKNVFIKFPSEVTLAEDEYIGVSNYFGYGTASGHKMYIVNGSATINYSLAYNVCGTLKTKFEKLQEDIDERPLEYSEKYYEDKGGASSVIEDGVFLAYSGSPYTGAHKVKVSLKTFSSATYVYVFEKNSTTLTCVAKSHPNAEGVVLVKNLDIDKEYVVGVDRGVKYKFVANPANYKMRQMSSNSYSVGDTATMPSPSLDMVMDVDVDVIIPIDYEWLDSTVKRLDKELPEVSNKNVVVVAKDGQGDFTSINAAISGTSYATKSNPVTIIVYPGIYEEVVNILGSSKYSIVGVNRDKCVIVDHSGKYVNCPLRIEGNAYVANLTLISDHSGTADFAENGELKYNPSYALHIDDRHDDDDDGYRVTIFNCRAVSHQNPAVGIGLDKNQVVELIQCEFESHWDDDVKNATIPSSIWSAKRAGGAVFWHALYPEGKYPISGASGYQKFIMKYCTVKANLNNTVFMEWGSSTDEEVEVTMIGNACYSETNGRTWHFKNGMTTTPISSGNNVSGMNAV